MLDAFFNPAKSTIPTKPTVSTTVTPQNPGSIWADPAFLAFQRSINGSMDAAMGSNALQGAAAKQALQMQLGGIDEQVKKGVARTGVVAAGQGTWSSGARRQDETNIENQGAAQAGAAQFGFDSRQAELTNSLADKVAEMRQRAAERGLQYAENMYANQEIL